MDKKLVARELLKIARILVSAETMSPKDSADELELYITNDAELYRSKFIPIVKNMLKFKKRGSYNSEEAVKGFMYLVKDGAKKYEKEVHSEPENDKLNLSKPVLEMVAKELVKSFETEDGYGNWDSLRKELGMESGKN